MSGLSSQQLTEVDFPIRRVSNLPSPRVAGVSVDATRAAGAGGWQAGADVPRPAGRGARADRAGGRLLRTYRHPPDQQEQAILTVLKQAELFSEEWVTA